MRGIYSEDWKDILDTVDEFFQTSSGVVWYRGHNDSCHELQSGLFRLPLSCLAEYIRLENKLYTSYKDLGFLLHGGLVGWELLYSMQHHGVATRLLDWTESFAVALYFAVQGWGSGQAAVWLLDPLALNVLSVGKREVILPHQENFIYPEMYAKRVIDHSIAIYPHKNTKRISMQQGVFTVQGNSGRALNEEFGGRLCDAGYLRKIELAETVRDDAIRFVTMNGINHFMLFPDLDGLAIYVNQVVHCAQF